MKINEIIPIVAAIIGLTPVFLKWLNDRSTEAAKRRSIQHAKEQVEFWQTWLQAQREVSTEERFAELKMKVSHYLDELMLQIMKTETEDKNGETDKKSPSFFRKLFLAYFPHTASGWIFHTLYYIVLTFILLNIYISFYPTDATEEPSWSEFVSNIDDTILVTLIFSAIAFGLQRLAIRSEKKYLRRLNKTES